MKNFLSLFFFAMSVFYACGDPGDSNLPPQDTTPTDTVSQTQPDTVPIGARVCGPFVIIANYIDSCGFTSDSTRLTKVYTELSDNKKLGVRHAFYLCDRSETCIGSMSDRPEAKVLVSWFDSVYAAKNEPVIEYFFTDDGSGGLYNDGIIEQWLFTDSTTARMAAEKIIFTENVFGHNAPPAVCYVDNFMYVFRSRSTPGMYALLPFFREFVKQNSAVVVARENGWQ